MATHSGTLAWKIPWTEKPGRLWTERLHFHFLTPAFIRMNNIIFSVFLFRHRGSNCLLLSTVSGVFVDSPNSINLSISYPFFQVFL